MEQDFSYILNTYISQHRYDDAEGDEQYTMEEDLMKIMSKLDKENKRLRKENLALQKERSSLLSELNVQRKHAEDLQHQLANTILKLNKQQSSTSDDATESTEVKSVHRRRKALAVNSDVVERIRNNTRYCSAVSEKAMKYWRLLIENNYVDDRLRRCGICSNHVAAVIASRFQTVVDPSIPWSFFNKHWKVRNLQSALNVPTDKSRKHIPIINAIFGLQPDSPIVLKSNL